jgi:general secretion pathway protein C
MNSIFGLDIATVLYRSRAIILAGFGILLGLLCARLAWLIIDPAGAVSQTRPLSGFDLPVGQNTARNVDITILTRANPFAASAQGPLEDIPDAPVTSLNLTLKGVRASEIDSLSSAIIVTPDNQSAVYTPGDEIIDRVILERVLSDRILLNKDGVFESLLLAGRNEELSVLTRPSDRKTRNDDNSAPTPNTSRTATPVDATTILSAMTLSPEQSDGNLIGYRIIPRGDGSAMRALGFEPGDLLIEFDGDNISDFGPADINDRLTSADKISLSVKRGEQTVPLTLTLDN